VQLVQDDATVLTNSPTRFATVTIQGGQTAVSSRRSDDIIVRADLTGLGAGTHTVPLVVSVATSQTEASRPQRIIAETQPAQITVELELRESYQKPVEIMITNAPPVGFTNDTPESDIFQAVVSGASSVVSQVVSVRGELDLSSNQNPLEMDTRLFAVDVDGERIDDVTIEPQTASVAVNITRRDDVKQVSVRPNILVGTQPEGYTLSTFSYEPQTLFISGVADQLESISDTIYTIPISLENRTEDFSIDVPLRLPTDDLFVMGGENNITVYVNILPQIEVRQFNDITIRNIGLADLHTVTIAPQTVSVVVNGPVASVNELTASDIQVVVDLNGLEAGQYDLAPSIEISKADLSGENASLLPAVVNVSIVSDEPPVEGTEELIPVTTPEAR
jgi:YbbR domain-containing protein